jgi:hypothetical protein
MATEIRYWKKLERHPLSQEYPDLPPATRERMRERLKQYGIILGRKIVLASENGKGKPKVLDGWQLLQACIDAEIKPDLIMLPKKISPEDFVEIANDCRRHEDMDTMRIRAEDRRQRVAKAREAGQSTRTIAEREKVSQSTIAEDLKVLTEQGVQTKPPDGEIIGRDNVARPATQPKLIPELAQLDLSPRLIPGLEAMPKTKQKKISELIAAGSSVRDAIKTITEPQEQRESGDDEQEDTERKKLAELKDDEGTPVPTLAAPAFVAAKEIEGICRDLNATIRTIGLVAKAPGGRMLHVETITHALKEAKGALWSNRATHVCPYCKGKGKKPRKDERCEGCKGEGWVNKMVFNNAPK